MEDTGCYYQISPLQFYTNFTTSIEMGVQGTMPPAGVRGVPALSPSPPSGLQARQNKRRCQTSYPCGLDTILCIITIVCILTMKNAD